MVVPKPRFYLKNSVSSELTLIVMQVKYEGQRGVLSSGNKVLPNDWDIVLQRVKVTKKNLEAGQINIWLDKIENEFKSVFRNLMIENIFPSQDLVTNKLKENLNLITKPKVHEPIRLSFMPFLSQFIEDSKRTKSANTVKSYTSTQKHVIDFSKQTGISLDFPDITIKWRFAFITYLQNMGVGKNTEGKHIKNIKVFMNEATERGLNDNLDFRSKSFSKPVEDVPKIFLTKEEIQLLFDLDLSADKSKEIVRDYFIISCMTSLRYSDFVRIKPEHIKDGNIQIITQKTSEEVIIPISPMIKSILEKYNFQLPLAPCNQVFNRILKEVGKAANLDENITITKTFGGVKRTTTYKKYELLTCHTGRRSMISNSILAGLPTSSIMLISAHKSLKVFQSYVRINQKQNADALANHSFFK
jgi:site-specific recombinase XerD